MTPDQKHNLPSPAWPKPLRDTLGRLMAGPKGDREERDKRRLEESVCVGELRIRYAISREGGPGEPDYDYVEIVDMFVALDNGDVIDIDNEWLADKIATMKERELGIGER